MNVVPKPPYHLKPLDALIIQVTGTPKEREIYGLFPIEPSGTVNLGVGYGTVEVSGLTIEDAQKKVLDHLRKILRAVDVQVSLGSSRAMQQISGVHLVRQDGTVSMGLYGDVYVTNMTLAQAKKAIEEHLSEFVLTPEISLDVYVYNSKWYYIIEDRAGFGQTVIRLPITGRDTVLDALSNLGGTFFMSSNRYIWLARPNGADPNKFQIFPINWPALTQGASPATNYQLLPGDRLFVQSNPLLKANNRLNQLFAPERTMADAVFGLTVLGTSTVSAVEGTHLLFKGASAGTGATGTILPGGVGSVGIVGR
jgi:polysaccharide export outer membrane protein